ncbi:MAG: hypothetical protein ABEI52_08395 [Halobacteriaceae archaeon]
MSTRTWNIFALLEYNSKEPPAAAAVEAYKVMPSLQNWGDGKEEQGKVHGSVTDRQRPYLTENDRQRPSVTVFDRK